MPPNFCQSTFEWSLLFCWRVLWVTNLCLMRNCLRWQCSVERQGWSLKCLIWNVKPHECRLRSKTYKGAVFVGRALKYNLSWKSTIWKQIWLYFSFISSLSRKKYSRELQRSFCKSILIARRKPVLHIKSGKENTQSRVQRNV